MALAQSKFAKSGFGSFNSFNAFNFAPKNVFASPGYAVGTSLSTRTPSGFWQIAWSSASTKLSMEEGVREDENAEEKDDQNGNTETTEGSYDPSEFDDLKVDDEVKELFVQILKLSHK